MIGQNDTTRDPTKQPRAARRMRADYLGGNAQSANEDQDDEHEQRISTTDNVTAYLRRNPLNSIKKSKEPNILHRMLINLGAPDPAVNDPESAMSKRLAKNWSAVSTRPDKKGSSVSKRLDKTEPAVVRRQTFKAQHYAPYSKSLKNFDVPDSALQAHSDIKLEKESFFEAQCDHKAMREAEDEALSRERDTSNWQWHEVVGASVQAVKSLHIPYSNWAFGGGSNGGAAEPSDAAGG